MTVNGVLDEDRFALQRLVCSSQHPIEYRDAIFFQARLARNCTAVRTSERFLDALRVLVQGFVQEDDLPAALRAQEYLAPDGVADAAFDPVARFTTPTRG